MTEPEVFISVDLELDGPIPGKFSMLSIGAAAFGSEGNMIATYSANLETLPGAEVHPPTMEWWKSHPAAWEACRKDLQSPEQTMTDFDTWVRNLPGTPVCVAYPVGCDFMFVQWYFHTFTGDSPFGHNALDIRSYAMALLKKPFYQSGRAQMPREWSDGVPLAHVAVDDAIAQGRLFCNMRKANLVDQ